MNNLNVEVIVLIDNVWYRLDLKSFSMAETNEGLKFHIEGIEKDEWDETKESTLLV